MERLNHFTGVNTPDEQEYELEHKVVSRKAATEGFVLLKNDDKTLPIDINKKIALYGAGAAVTIKGGTGSGDVNERNVVNIYEGLKNAGYEITTEAWINEFRTTYAQARLDWRQSIWNIVDNSADADSNPFVLFMAYSETPFAIPAGAMPTKTEADVAVYVLSRNAGEGADRFNKEGDYLLTKEEEGIISSLCELYSSVVLILNVGGIVDLKFTTKYKNIKSILLASQPGLEAGNAIADVLSGKVTPSGKLTDTWAFDYSDYSTSETFSHNNNDVQKEIYEEGLYVGYRYFDKLQKPVHYGFGFGLSYTTFEVKMLGIEKSKASEEETFVTLKVSVKNTGGEFEGKEVVQVYVTCPQGSQEKELRRLVGFQKTKLLKLSEEEVLEIKVPLSYLTSYFEESNEWLLDSGNYGVLLGNSIENSKPVASIEIQKSVVFQKTTSVCKVNQEIKEIELDSNEANKKLGEWSGLLKDCPTVSFGLDEIKVNKVKGELEIDSKVIDFVNTLSLEQLIKLSTGKVSQVQTGNLGAAGQSVPGAAAETSDCAEANGLESIVLADGPAGLRLTKTYFVKDGKIVQLPFEMSLEGGFLCRNNEYEGEKWYQYCTSIPVGTLLAQTWNLDLIKEVGEMVAYQMELFNVTLWLAPGMNIHRNPLCGRNFEYYSEDPVLTGKVAAAMTIGVQSRGLGGTTLKHFACNNQEDNRMGSDSRVTERTLRELYLKGFEIAVKESNPHSIMTSYNLVNGVHAANNYDLCTTVLRDEWGFEGVVMTDWTTTHNNPKCTAAGCIKAGNDLVMPGTLDDHKSIKEAIEKGELSLEELKKCVARFVSVVWKTR